MEMNKKFIIMVMFFHVYFLHGFSPCLIRLTTFRARTWTTDTDTDIDMEMDIDMDMDNVNEHHRKK